MNIFQIGILKTTIKIDFSVLVYMIIKEYYFLYHIIVGKNVQMDGIVWVSMCHLLCI